MQKINWAHARKKGYMEEIATMVQQHDVATPNQQVHLRAAFAVYVQKKYLHLENAPCIYCGGNADYMNEARGIVAEEQAKVQTLPAVKVDDTQKRSKASKQEKERNITETE